MAPRPWQGLLNLCIGLSAVAALFLAFWLGRLTAPPHRLITIEAPGVDAVTIARPPDVMGEGLGIYENGDLIGIWRPKDGAVYRLLERIHDNPRAPEKWGDSPAWKTAGPAPSNLNTDGEQ